MTLKKSIAALLSAAVMSVTAVPAAAYTASAAELAPSPDYNAYYFAQLSEKSKKFYGAIASMEQEGTLAAGTGEYDLIAGGVLTAEEARFYAAGGNDLLVAYGAARDAYALDHPDVFYVDFSQLTLSVGKRGNSYVATLGTGRSDNFRLHGTDGAVSFQDSAAVNAAVAQYGAALSQIAEKLDTDDALACVKGANGELLKVEYSFETASGGYTQDEPFIRTAYGALVKGKSVCEGFARAFKSIMDEVGVPCVLVQGYAVTEEGYDAHMWNYVQIDGKWYGVDPTWNSAEGAVGTEYLLLGSVSMQAEHDAVGVVSSSGFEFRYPALYAYDYGTNPDGFDYGIERVSDDTTVTRIRVSYNGKGAKTLEAEGRYLSVRYYTDGAWSSWAYIANKAWADTVTNEVDHTVFLGNAQFRYLQFAVIDRAPDFYDTSYTPATAEEYLSVLGAEIDNPVYGEYFAPPYPVSCSPVQTAALDIGKTHEFTIVYSEPLKRTGGETGMTVTTASGAPVKRANVTSFEWSESEPNKVTFTLEPSLTFNETDYTFIPKGLAGENSGKTPVGAGYRIWKQPVVCNRVYGDGRLYMSVSGAPQIVSEGDLSEQGWQIGGEYAAKNQMSRLMLVASRPDGEREAELTEQLGGVAQGVIAASTYEIDLRLCGSVTSIPNGSYLQVGFGFPEGYGPEDAGVTFKVYHYVTQNGEITGVEEIPCVVTQFGIVATVDSFSPFAVVAVNKNGTDKGVYAYSAGNGSVSGEGVGGAVAKVSAGGAVTYTFAPAEGYALDAVFLNGEKREISGSTLTLAYEELAENNVLEAQFVAESVKEREAAEGIEHVARPLSTNDPMGELSVSVQAEKTKYKAGETCVLRAETKQSNATVTGNITYVWYRNGEIVEGENGAELELSDMDESKAGSYGVKAVCEYNFRVKSASGEPVDISVAEGGNGALIAGIVIASAALVALVLVLVLFVFKKKPVSKKVK